MTTSAEKISPLESHSAAIASPGLDGGALQPADGLSETVVTTHQGVRFFQSLRDLWLYRDLFHAFVVRDLKVRYKQTALGVVWVVLQPLLTGGLLAIVFSRLGVAREEGAVSPLLFFMAGLVPWNSFASALQNASTGMEANAHLITKVYFPRLVIPGAAVCGSILDFLVAFPILVAVAWYSGRMSASLLVWMPLLLAFQSIAACGFGFFLGALNAQYRDVKYAIPFLLQIGMLLTVLLPLSSWPANASAVLSFNPMAVVIESYRSILSGVPLDPSLLLQGAGMSLALFAGGLWFFRAREARMVDIL